MGCRVDLIELSLPVFGRMKEPHDSDGITIDTKYNDVSMSAIATSQQYATQIRSLFDGSA